MSYNIPITLFRDLPVYSGSLPPDGVQLIVVNGNTGLCRAGLSSVLDGTATVATGVPAYPGDTVPGELAWEDGAFYVNTPAGWEKMAVYSDHWDDIVPGTRFMRVDDTMSLTATEIDNVLASLDIAEATTSKKGIVCIAGSISDTDKVATAGLVKDYVDTFSDRMEEVYTYVQEAVEEVGEDREAVEAVLEDVQGIASEVEGAKSYVDDVKDDVDALASQAVGAAGRAEMAAERAEAVEANIPGVDEFPTADSRNVVRSGGIKVWGDTTFAPLDHIDDIGTGYSEPHISDDERTLWNEAAEDKLDEKYVDALKRIVDDGEITGEDIRIGTSEDDTTIWSRIMDYSGKTALSLTADNVSILSMEPANVTGGLNVVGQLSATGTITSNGREVITTNDAGAFPTGGSQVDGYAMVGDAVRYIALVEDSLKEYMEANYARTSTSGSGYAILGEDNIFTARNTFAGDVLMYGVVRMDSGQPVYCMSGLNVAGGDIELAAGNSINASSANLGSVSADFIDVGTGGSMRVEGEASVIDLEVDGDMRVRGTSQTDGASTLMGTLNVHGITTFNNRIDSDVVIGYGDLGNVKAETLLNIGDPKESGTIEYNGYKLVLPAGTLAQAKGKIALNNGYQVCTITIGNETRSIGPIPIEDPTVLNSPYAAEGDVIDMDSSGNAVLAEAAPLKAASAPLTAKKEESLPASCIVGPSSLHPSSAGSDYSLVGEFTSITISYNGNDIYRVPRLYEWVQGGISYGRRSLCNITAALMESAAIEGVTSPVMQYILGAYIVTPPGIPSGETRPYFNEVQVQVYAKQTGPAGNAFQVSATGFSTSRSRDIPLTRTADIVAPLQYGEGLQQARCAIGVMMAKDLTTGQWRLPEAKDYYKISDDPRVYFRVGGYITIYKGSNKRTTSLTGGKNLSELCSYIPSLLPGGLPIDFYNVVAAPVHIASSSSRTGTIHAKAQVEGEESNEYRIEIYLGPPGGDFEAGTARYFQITMFGGLDGDDPGSESWSESESDTGSQSDTGSESYPGDIGYVDIGPSPQETGGLWKYIGLTWDGPGPRWTSGSAGAPDANIFYYIPAVLKDTYPAAMRLEDVVTAINEEGPSLWAHLTALNIQYDPEDPSRTVVRLGSSTGNAIDNYFGLCAVGDDGTTVLKDSISGCTRAYPTRAIGVLTKYYYDESGEIKRAEIMTAPDRNSYPIAQAGSDVVVYYDGGVIARSVSGGAVTLSSLQTLIPRMMAESGMDCEMRAYVVNTATPYGASHHETNEYTLHLVAFKDGAFANNYKIRIGKSVGIDMFGGSGPYVPPWPKPEPGYFPVTVPQIVDLVNTIPGYIGTLSGYVGEKNVVNIQATEYGSIGNKPMIATGGLEVRQELQGGKDDRTAADLASEITNTDIFDVTAHVQSENYLRIVANKAGDAPNDRPITTTGCFGERGAVMGSLVKGAYGVEKSSYKLWLNGEQILPGGGGGGGGGCTPFDGHLDADLVIGRGGEYTAFAVCELAPGSLYMGGTLTDSNGQSVVLGIPVERATGHVDIADISAGGSIKFGEHDAIVFAPEETVQASVELTPVLPLQDIQYDLDVSVNGGTGMVGEWFCLPDSSTHYEVTNLEELVAEFNSNNNWGGVRPVVASAKDGKLVLTAKPEYAGSAGNLIVLKKSTTGEKPFMEDEARLSGGVDGIATRASGSETIASRSTYAGCAVVVSRNGSSLDVATIAGTATSLQAFVEKVNANAKVAKYVTFSADGQVLTATAVEAGAAGNELSVMLRWMISPIAQYDIQLSGGSGTSRTPQDIVDRINNSQSSVPAIAEITPLPSYVSGLMYRFMVRRTGGEGVADFSWGGGGSVNDLVEHLNDVRYWGAGAGTPMETPLLSAELVEGSILLTVVDVEWAGAAGNGLYLDYFDHDDTLPFADDIPVNFSGGSDASTGYATASLDSSGQGIDFIAVDKGVEDHIYTEGSLFNNATGMSGSSSVYVLEDLVDAIKDNFADVTPSISESGTMIRMTAKEPGSAANYITYTATGCFGNGVTRQGSVEEGRDAMEPTTYKIYLNGEEFKGGGIEDLDPLPVEGSDDTAVSSGGVYDVTYVRDGEIPPAVVSKATTGSGEVNAYNTDKYAKIGLYHVSGLVGKLVKVKMKNRSDGNIYNVHLQVSYDETFQDSTTRLSYDKIGATGDHLLEWLEWNFDDPLELTGDKPLYVRWRKPDVTAENVYTYSRKYGTIAGEDDSFTTHDGVFERNVPLCELFVETEPGRVEKVWAGPELAAHEDDTVAHKDSTDNAELSSLKAGGIRLFSAVGPGTGPDNFDTLVLKAPHTHGYSVKAVTLRNHTRATSDTPVYLGVFQRDAGSSETSPWLWRKLGVSVNAQGWRSGEYSRWEFDGVRADGARPIAFISMASRDAAEAGGPELGVLTLARPAGDSDSYITLKRNGWRPSPDKVPEYILETEVDVVGGLQSKQDRLTAGANITIDGNNVIAAASTPPFDGNLDADLHVGTASGTARSITLNGRDILSISPAPESTLPAVLRHNHVYTVAVASGTVDLSAKTVEQGATAELYIDYTGGTLKLPSWWWLDGMSSSEGDHDIPPWGQDMEANHRYVVVVRNDGRKTVANVQYEYPL